MSSKPKILMSIFTVEGNIGSGKTTLISELQNYKFIKPHIVVFEQVKEWSELKDNSGNNILSLFYKDKKKYSYIFQSYVLFSRLTHMLNTIKQNPDSIIITERCHLTDLYVFAKSLFELGDINSMEWEVYNMWHSQLRDLFNIKIKGTIYINTSPEVCYQRIKKRSRNGEESIPLDYLTLLHNKHNDWLLERPKQNPEVEWFSLQRDSMNPILNLDGNVDIYDYEERAKQKKMIEKFVNYEI